MVKRKSYKKILMPILYGIEINDEIARVAKMNMIVHDDGHTNVISFVALDSIEKMHQHNRGFEEDKFDGHNKNICGIIDSECNVHFLTNNPKNINVYKFAK